MPPSGALVVLFPLVAARGGETSESDPEVPADLQGGYLSQLSLNSNKNYGELADWYGRLSIELRILKGYFTDLH